MMNKAHRFTGYEEQSSSLHRLWGTKLIASQAVTNKAHRFTGYEEQSSPIHKL
jgi:hypothetical protein